MNAKGDRSGLRLCQPSILVLMSSLLAVAAFFLCCHGLAQHARHRGQFLPLDAPIAENQILVATSMEYVVNSSESNDVLFLGDSTCRFAVVPILFERQTGLRAYNLGTNGYFGIDAYGTILRMYLQHHPKPHVVVPCISPGMLCGSFKAWSFFHDYFFAVFGERRQLDVNSLTWDARLAMRELRYDEKYLDMPVLGLPGSTTYAQVRATCVANRGYWPILANAVGHRTTAGDAAPPRPVNADVENDLIEFARAVREIGVPLLVRFTPIAAGEGSCVPIDMGERLSGLAEHALIGRPIVLEYPAECLVEWDHCNQGGAERFTRFVADEVSRLVSSDELARRH